MRVHAVERAVVQQQLRRRLRADARNAGNIVRAVAHKRLEVDQMDGIEAVFLAEFRGVVIDRDSLGQLG